MGPLGAVYPEPMFIMEGDTPATLFVLPNGLNVPENPNLVVGEEGILYLIKVVDLTTMQMLLIM